MSIHQIILSVLATLSSPDDVKPKIKHIIDHYFCCGSVSSTGHGSGTECRKTDEGEVQLCERQLICAAGYTVDGVVTTCTAPGRKGAEPPSRFCCGSTWTDGEGHSVGDECERSVDGTCNAGSSLACFGSWTKSDGVVTCL